MTALALASGYVLAATSGPSDRSHDHRQVHSTWVQSIVLQTPAPHSTIEGDVPVAFQAPRMAEAQAFCWQQPTSQHPQSPGHDAPLAEMKLDAQGRGSFIFHAAHFPNGPTTVRILASSADNSLRDLYELHLYNSGGVVWRQGIPKSDPPAANGMTLVFSDDFNGPLSISRSGERSRYGAHTPWNGDFSGWPFADVGGINPFSRVGTFLRIHASKGAFGASTGLISSVALNGTGFSARAPCYFECRFVAEAAPGAWPAFWLSTNKAYPAGTANDELDAMEGYGGLGKGNPNDPGYSVTTHYWNQKGPDGKPLRGAGRQIEMQALGSHSFWSTTFHTYGVKITRKDTIYYLDNMEVFRHPSGLVSRTQSLFFLINYAIGGVSGWKIDLKREGNAADMYVDYVRVYEGEDY